MSRCRLRRCRRRQILIGAQTWEIRFVRRGHALLEDDAEDVDVDGRTHARRCLIAVSDDLRGGALEDTILHELLHAVLHVSGASQDMMDGVEENLVRALTPILHVVMARNGSSLIKRLLR